MMQELVNFPLNPSLKEVTNKAVANVDNDLTFKVVKV